MNARVFPSLGWRGSPRIWETQERGGLDFSAALAAVELLAVTMVRDNDRRAAARAHARVHDRPIAPSLARAPQEAMQCAASCGAVHNKSQGPELGAAPPSPIDDGGALAVSRARALARTPTARLRRATGVP